MFHHVSSRFVLFVCMQLPARPLGEGRHPAHLAKYLRHRFTEWFRLISICSVLPIAPSQLPALLVLQMIMTRLVSAVRLKLSTATTQVSTQCYTICFGMANRNSTVPNATGDFQRCKDYNTKPSASRRYPLSSFEELLQTEVKLIQ